MLPESKWNQFGFPRTENDIKCIVIHNTGNTYQSAKQLAKWFEEECRTSQGCTYLVDHEEVIQLLPDEWAVYNTGKGKDYACQYGIAIEICDNLNDELYQEGEDRAVELIKDLMKRYNILTDDVFFHKDFNPTTYCPHIMLDRYGCSQSFVYQKLREE